MQDALAYYVKLISHLRTDRNRVRFPVTTRHRAPHKPILLLAILDLLQQGELQRNFVEPSPELADLFAGYWDLVMPADRAIRLFLPFFHMKNDGFWHLVPFEGKETALEHIRQISGPSQLRETVQGGQFDAELYDLLCIVETRDTLRTAIIETYFDESLQPALRQQSSINVGAFQYSRALLEQARQQKQGTISSEDEALRPLRDQGFRRAIVTAYNHRCVLCGVRLVTRDGRTVATAAHIIPWSVSHNDDPRNGLCLCRLCHWAFDVGMAGINARYRIRLSSELMAGGNAPGHLSTLHDRPIFEPVEDVFFPDINALNWHMKQIFLG